jgi:hypothetical protein
MLKLSNRYNNYNLFLRYHDGHAVFLSTLFTVSTLFTIPVKPYYIVIYRNILPGNVNFFYILVPTINGQIHTKCDSYPSGINLDTVWAVTCSVVLWAAENDSLFSGGWYECNTAWQEPLQDTLHQWPIMGMFAGERPGLPVQYQFGGWVFLPASGLWGVWSRWSALNCGVSHEDARWKSIKSEVRLWSVNIWIDAL